MQVKALSQILVPVCLRRRFWNMWVEERNSYHMCLSSRFVDKTLHPFSEAVGSNTFAHQLHHQLTIMPVISDRVSIRSLDFRTQRKAYMLRYIKKQSWETIAQQIRNVSGDHPSWGCVRDTVQGISVSKGIFPLRKTC